MRISFLVNNVYGGWEPADKRLGGTEESIREWAEELAERGHSVSIYRNGRYEGLTELTYPSGGVVDYYPRESYVKHPKGDVCINVKSSEINPIEPTLYLTNETDAKDKDLSKYVGVIWPSQWAVDNIPVNNKTFILPHGYDSTQIYPGKKVPKQCLYASSPDRGLDTLLRAWPSVMRAHPDATLIVTYGAPEYDVEGVTFVDADEEQMNELYRTSDIWAYPCNGSELYCMTGIKAQAAGCIPVIIPKMALAETVKIMYKASNQNYTAMLISVLDSAKERQVLRDALAREHYPNWQGSTDRLEQIIAKVLK